MQITDLEVKNFKSLQHVKISDLGRLNVFIGGNSFGKSNILEALFIFFNEFDGAIERNIGAVDQYSWFDRDSSQPIEFRVALNATKQELDFLPRPVLEVIKVSEINSVRIVRTISGSHAGASWHTTNISINNIAVIDKGQLMHELSGKELDDLSASIAQLKSTVHAQPATKRPVGPATAPAVVSPPTDYIGMVLQGLSQKLKGMFVPITAARNVASSPTGLSPRATFIPQAITADLVRLGQLIGPRPDEKMWIAIDGSVKDVSASIQDLRIMGGRVTVREQDSDMYLPVEYTGGGYQEIIGMIHELVTRENAFFGIEEPELHLNPSLARGFLEVLKELSKDKQTIITTHSTIFVDQVDIGNTWIVKKKGKATKVEKIQEPAELRSVLFELGLRPSDLFFADGIIFVEGPSDKVVLPILAQKLGIDLRRPRVSVIPTYGKSSGKYHLKVWTEAATNANVPFFVLLDKGAEDEAKKLSKSLRPEDNLFFLAKGSIEDYYPEEKLREGIKDAYGIEVTKEEASKIFEIPRTKKVEEYLRSKVDNADGWKTLIGLTVANKMQPDDIAEDLKRILERIATKIRLQP
jgi:ABC-type branched-subunit amino acid transport system ATPase component